MVQADGAEVLTPLKALIMGIMTSVPPAMKSETKDRQNEQMGKCRQALLPAVDVTIMLKDDLRRP